jgi:type IV fimbrial biogenesis protein FimT
MAFSKYKSAGFSLIELMIVVVLLGIVASVSFPYFRTMLMNSQIRNATESIVNGLQKARAEAVKRNLPVKLVLGADSGWIVSCDTVAACPDLVSGVVEQRVGNEGSANITLVVLPAAATTATFTNFGGVITNTDGSASLTQVDISATGGDKPLRVQILAGGTARMCDPSLSVTTNPRGC